MIRRTIGNPTLLPAASSTERQTGWREAKASCRPRMMQFTTISGTNGPIALWMTGCVAWSVMSAMLTNVAMIMMYAEIRTSFGMNRLSEDTIRLENTSTKATAMLIATALATVLVTARAG